MAKATKSKKKPIDQYDHKGKKRVNNPPVGLVTPETDKETGKKTYAYDPHLDPQLVWAGKAERTSFEVPTVSLHVHERIDPRTIVEAVRKRNGQSDQQMSLFQSPGENPPLREAIEFYKHPHNWSNRLIAGDSLLVMNSLLEKEGMAGQVQMIYVDPPYGIRYGSNFQPFVNKRDVRDGKDEDLTQEPEMIRAFRDTWELGIHSYLTYLRDRLLLARELLSESGSLFVQISDENVHHVREIMDEVFGTTNFVNLITFAKTSNQTTVLLSSISDYLLWYAKDKTKLKFRKLFFEKAVGGLGGEAYNRVELVDGRRMTVNEAKAKGEDLANAKFYRLSDMRSQRPPGDFSVELNGKEYRPTKGYWKTGPEGFKRLIGSKRIEVSGNQLNYVRYLSDFPAFPLSNLWDDTGSSVGTEKTYVVQSAIKVVQRCSIDGNGARRFGFGHYLWQRYDGLCG
jgi:adenine-specific DNA-methyltransferase